MNKNILRISLIALCFVWIAYLALDLVLGQVVKAGVNRFGPSITQTSVHLDGAHLSPLSGSGTLSGFVVGNPKGWSGDHALSFSRVKVSLSPFSIFGDHIVIHEVLIDGPSFVYETKLVSSNIGDLLSNVKGTSEAPATPASNGKPIKFIIEKFRITNAKVSLGVGPTAITLPMPPISLDNLGASTDGVSAAELATVIMRSVATGTAKTATEAAAKIGSALGGAAGSATESAVDSVKQLFGSKK